jgi:16S rRNA (guanine966-N2)-methyltransferase
MSRKKPQKNNKRSNTNTLRIIGGEWRSRKLLFIDAQGLRPTPDRIRETLFNWLQGRILGANCLDLFAGSGVLGLEALSRGANQVDFVEKNKAVAKQLESNLGLLKSDSNVYHQDALDYLLEYKRGKKKGGGASTELSRTA